VAIAGADVRLGAGARADSGASAAAVQVALVANQPLAATASVAIPAGAPVSQPYWLDRPADGAVYAIANDGAAWPPENPPVLAARVVLAVDADTIGFDVPVAHRWVDPVEGERWRPLQVVPPVTFRFDHGVYLFRSDAPREIRVVADAADTALAGTVALVLPQGWTSEPPVADLRFARGADRSEQRFRITPGARNGVLRAEYRGANRTFSNRLVAIDHTHVPVQNLYPPAEAKLIRADVRSIETPVAYVMGSGDAVPDALDEMGFRVTQITEDDIENGDLSRYGAVVVGVRAYNTRPRLQSLGSKLNDYVEKGGRLVVQYQTPDAALNGKIGPKPFTLTRDRVTDERAEMKSLLPQHSLLATPNRIVNDDWNGWVQERGLSYANPYDPSYDAPLAAADKGEPDRPGGLIYVHHGSGDFIYTGLSFFRQLPAGVPGAYRLFSNLVSPSPRN
jgi:hypothetical protein